MWLSLAGAAVSLSSAALLRKTLADQRAREEIPVVQHDPVFDGASWQDIANKFEPYACLDVYWPSMRNGHWYIELADAVRAQMRRDYAHVSLPERARLCWTWRQRLVRGIDKDAPLSHKREYVHTLLKASQCSVELPSTMRGHSDRLINALMQLDVPSARATIKGSETTSAPKIAAAICAPTPKERAACEKDSGIDAALSAFAVDSFSFF